MKLLLLLSLVGLAMGQAILPKPVESVDIGQRDVGVYQNPQEAEEPTDVKKLDKRSFGWSPWIWPSYGHGHGLSYGHGWPSYGHGWSSHGWGGWGGHGLHSGWSLGWPIWYGGGHGWHGGWHGGWHNKW